MLANIPLVPSACVVHQSVDRPEFAAQFLDQARHAAQVVEIERLEMNPPA
jgi:hypothetical protein